MELESAEKNPFVMPEYEADKDVTTAETLSYHPSFMAWSFFLGSGRQPGLKVGKGTRQ